MAAESEGAKMVSPEHELLEDCAGHASHMCEMVAKRQMAKVGRLAKGANYICHICGRAAAKGSNLCEPVAL